MKTKLLFIAGPCLFCLALPLLSGCENKNEERVVRMVEISGKWSSPKFSVVEKNGCTGRSGVDGHCASDIVATAKCRCK